MAASMITCTYCDPPVPAAKTCLDCEASLCADHLNVHSKSTEHILIDCTSSLESWKCSIHNQIFRYFCSEDGVCLCLTCCLSREHQEHHLQPIFEASERFKTDLQGVFQTLALQKEKKEEDIKSLEENMRDARGKPNVQFGKVTALFQDIRGLLDVLERQVLQEISRPLEKVAQSLSELIQELEMEKDELSRKMELLNMTDPIMILQQGKAIIEESSTPESHIRDSFSRHTEKIQQAGDLDEGLISMTITKGLSDVMSYMKRRLHIQEDSTLTLDLKTAGEFVDISGDLKGATSSKKKIVRPKMSERFQYSQVLSMESFSSGRHCWEVQTNDMGNWRVGVCYASMNRRGEQSYIGDNCKSWCLAGCNKLYTVMHNKWVSHLYHTAATTGKLGVYLDYEGGQLSFYELGDVVRHLHTFNASFTEPLYAAFGVWNSSVRI